MSPINPIKMKVFRVWPTGMHSIRAFGLHLYCNWRWLLGGELCAYNAGDRNGCLIPGTIPKTGYKHVAGACGCGYE